MAKLLCMEDRKKLTEAMKVVDKARAEAARYYHRRKGNSIEFFEDFIDTLNGLSRLRGHDVLEEKPKKELRKGGLWLTGMGSIVLDARRKENFDTFSEPYDKKLMTRGQLSKGIKLKDFQCKLLDVLQKDGE